MCLNKVYTFCVSHINILFLHKKIMKTISLKIDDDIFSETEEILAKVKKSRNRYINEALMHYNHMLSRIIIKKKLRKESELISEDSMKVLRDFEDIDYED